MHPSRYRHTKVFVGLNIKIVCLITAIFFENISASKTWVPVSPKEAKGLLCGIQKYGTKRFWDDDALKTVKTALERRVKGHQYHSPIPYVFTNNNLTKRMKN